MDEPPSPAPDDPQAVPPGHGTTASDAQPAAQEVQARSLLRVQPFTDAWFVARYGMNLYRGCAHGCLYCDGRAEKYYVEGDFARDIQVKVNALALLDRELARLKEPGLFFIGGGVSDAWQPAEARYALARGVLERLHAQSLGAHVLTKSALLDRDLELLQAIDQRRRAIVSVSIQTTDEAVRARFEPGAASLAQRWDLLARAKALGLSTGVMAMPILPGISDTQPAIDALVARAADCGVDFMLFSGLTLRPGVQKQTWLDAVAQSHPALLPGYQALYHVDRPSGVGTTSYARRLEQRFSAALDRHRMPGRMPRRLFSGIIPQYTEIAVLLEHREYRDRCAGHTSPPLARAGQALQTWARRRWTESGRRHDFDHHTLEAELGAAVADGSIVDQAQLDPRVLPTMRALLAELPPPRGQMRLGFG